MTNNWIPLLVYGFLFNLGDDSQSPRIAVVSKAPKVKSELKLRVRNCTEEFTIKLQFCTHVPGLDNVVVHGDIIISIRTRLFGNSRMIYPGINELNGCSVIRRGFSWRIGFYFFLKFKVLFSD